MISVMDALSKDQKLILSICKFFIHGQKIDQETIETAVSRTKLINENKLPPIF